MSSKTLNDLLARTVAVQHPALDVAGLDKAGILRAVLRTAGWSAVVTLGREVRTLRGHPVFSALAAARSPLGVVERWMKLERFGHSRNRTHLIREERKGEESLLVLAHKALDGGPISAVNDLFVWGVLIGLLEAAGIVAIHAVIVQDAAPALDLLAPHEDAMRSLPACTAVVHLGGRPAAVTVPYETKADLCAPFAFRVKKVILRDVSKNWAVDQVARELRLSSRTLQRSLRHERTTLTEIVQTSRVAVAQTLIETETLDLTAIAFCAGFSDLAHFSRVFRRYREIPPSVYREIWTMSDPAPPAHRSRTADLSANEPSQGPRPSGVRSR